MSTSFVVIACTSDKRWFDLDAVRGDGSPNTHARVAQGVGSRPTTGKKADNPNNNYGSMAELETTGAPPLDWWDETDPPPTPRHDGTRMTTSTVTFHCGDVRDVMNTMPDGSVDLVVTSPPFLALRSYLPADHPDKHREIGSEATPAAFLDTMLGLTADWRRIVTATGSIAVEIGDTYAGSGPGTNTGSGISDSRQRARYTGTGPSPALGPGWPLAKSLCGIPTLYTWSLAYGRNLLTGQPSPAGQWRIRNLLTWTRPNPPVGALGDKFRPATSFVTVACTSDRRWFDLDAVRTEHGENATRYDRRQRAIDKNEQGMNASRTADLNPAGAPPLDWWDDTQETTWTPTNTTAQSSLSPSPPSTSTSFDSKLMASNTGSFPSTSVYEDDWQPLHRLPTAPYAGAHYATYPVTLPRRLIEAMCPRAVCAVCGEARRRMAKDTSAMDPQRDDLARHIRERRERAGMALRDVDILLGTNGMASHYESTGIQRLVPTPQAWAVLRSALDLSNEFDDLVLGDRRWAESLVEYVNYDGDQITTKRMDYGKGQSQTPGQHDRMGYRLPTDRWSDCGHDSFRPGVVLDPFAGSGTTAVAAAQCGRDAVLIDIDHRNLELTRQRLAESVAILAEHVDGDTVTWTVNASLPGVKGEAAGQLNLFAEEAS